MKLLVLVNGELYRPEVLRERLAAEAFDGVFGVDGGSRYAAELGVRVTTVVGDLDSLLPDELAALGNVEVLQFPKAKDEVDLELALLEAARRDTDRVVVAGMMGGRLDMSLANLHLLAHPDLAGCRIEVWHGDQTAWVLRPPGEDITGKSGDTVSLIPLAGDATDVTTRALAYPLRAETLGYGAGRGLSNVMESEIVRVEFVSGLLLAVHTPAAKGDYR